MAKQPKTWTLTIFLLAERVRTARDALKVGQNPAEHEIALGHSEKGHLFTQQAGMGPPKWTELMASAAEPRVRLQATFASGLLILEADGRLFALTFGHGRFMLEPGAWEESFGLRVTLNSVDPQRLRSIDHKKFEAITRHSRTQTNQEGKAADFGIDVEQDLVRAVTGKPKDPALGKRMSGMDALVVNVAVQLSELPALLSRYLDRYTADDYKSDFSWVDHVAEVRDPSLVLRLDEKLVETIRKGSFDKLWLCIPEIVDWSNLSGVCYGRRDKTPKPDVHMIAFLASLPDPKALDIDDLRKRSVRALDPEEMRERHEWPVYRCVYFECELDSSTFVLTNGKWYRVSGTFLSSVQHTIEALASAVPALPNFETSDGDEQGYNARVARTSSGTYVLMDRRFARLGGSPIEVCDLYSARHEFIHVKRYHGSSAPLSHLFSQGVNAAVAWLSDATFREDGNQLLPLHLRTPAGRPNTQDYTVVFAVVSRSARPIAEGLPFFSKLSLRNAARTLESLGFRVALVKVAA